jgi:MoaA/NifB/PqqE/SkfB family radical SAM enzyme
MARKYLLNFKYSFRVQKPRLILRLVLTYLGILFLGKRPLRYVDLAIGYACNLRCEHCFATALERQGRRRIRPKEYRLVVRQAMAMGAVNFSFQGGEPALYPDLVEFIRNSFPERNVISVTTNGTLLDEEKIVDLKEAGVDILTISLDSGIAEEHDRFRGVPGTFAKTMQCIRSARRQGLRVTLGAVVSHKNIRSRGLVELIDLAHRMNTILFLALAAPVGEWKEKEEVVLTPDDRVFLGDLLRRYPLVRTDFQANFIHTGCGAVKEILYVTPYGDVLGCPFLHFALGNVFEETLDAIRQRAIRNPYFAGYYPLCLAAEDRDFMRTYSGDFYLPTGEVRRLG